ncbi:MAG: DUF5103 domain-containing protein [Prevotella sp.]|nr:DUF5103 domain-containing protein [Prevotella sp.]
MKRLYVTLITALLCLSTSAQHRVFTPDIKTLTVVAGNDWLSPPIITLDQDERLSISFDRMDQVYHQYTYHVEHCEADWSNSSELFEVEWLQGFNDQPIEDYEMSINTTVPYIHYRTSIPNEQTQLKLSGNYKFCIIDEEGETAAEVRFMVVEQLMPLSMEVSSNTDIDVNLSHQQLTMALNFGSFNVTRPQEQIYTVVTQNQQWERAIVNPAPDGRSAGGNGLSWSHNRQFIFEAGNEYHKFETLATSHPTMGIDRMEWDGTRFNAYPFEDELRRNYLYDEDADGAFYIRNSDNWENDVTSDYVLVNYCLRCPFPFDGQLFVNGTWTTDASSPDTYALSYDSESHCYRAAIWQKQGYYNYQYVLRRTDGNLTSTPIEGSFYQTENKYQAYVYYKGLTERTWRLVGYRQLIFK